MKLRARPIGVAAVAVAAALVIPLTATSANAEDAIPATEAAQVSTEAPSAAPVEPATVPPVALEELSPPAPAPVEPIQAASVSAPEAPVVDTTLMSTDAVDVPPSTTPAQAAVTDTATTPAVDDPEDTTPPRFIATTPANGGHYGSASEVIVDFACEDPESGIDECTLLDEGGSSVAGGTQLDLPDGRHTWTGIAVNALGFTTTTKIHFSVGNDSVAPSISTSWTEPANGWTTDYYIDFTAEDDLSGVASIFIKRGGSLRQLDTSTASYELQLGAQSIEYWAVDKAGNESEHSIVRPMADYERPNINVDSAIVPVDGNVSEVLQGAIVPFYFYCEDSLSGIADCVPDRVPGASIDTSTVGTHELVVFATDVAGNRRTASYPYVVVADPANPGPDAPGPTGPDAPGPTNPNDPAPGIPTAPRTPERPAEGAAQAQADRESLASTGYDSTWLLIVGSILMLCGTAPLLVRRIATRRTER